MAHSTDDPFDGLPEAPPRVEKPLTVSELTARIKAVLEAGFDRVCVEGEISNFKVYSSGHAYFSLKDDGSQIPCVMFRTERQGLKFKPEDGMKVEATGRISVYAPRGAYQLIVESMTEQGLGALFKAFNELKERLEREGLFAAEHKNPLPFLPRRIGVITSPSGAAVRDILNVLGRRFVNMEVYLYPVRVQGVQAPAEIARAIKRMNELNLADVLIVGRGGGSIEDLWAFNDEGVARAIHASAIPIISAVGHETDFTIADFVADLRAPTPSAAAELVSQNQRELAERLRELSRRCDRLMLSRLSEMKLRLRHLLEGYAMRRPVDRLREYQQRLDELRRRMDQTLGNRLEISRHRLVSLTGRLEALNPSAVLQRGYSVVTRISDKILIRSATQVRPHEKLNIRTADGDFPATATPPIRARQQELF